MSYKLSRFPCIIRLSDGASIPIDDDNGDYQEYLRWLAAGNKPAPADPPPPPDKSEVAKSDAKEWYEANPNAALLFEMPHADLIAELDSLDLSTLPAATRTRLRLLLKTLATAVRVLARREGLIKEE